MRKQEAPSRAVELQNVLARVRKPQRAEGRLVRDLQTCIETTNKPLARIGESTAGGVGHTPKRDDVAKSNDRRAYGLAQSHAAKATK